MHLFSRQLLAHNGLKRIVSREASLVAGVCEGREVCEGDGIVIVLARSRRLAEIGLG